jgi:hypothetical protein
MKHPNAGGETSFPKAADGYKNNNNHNYYCYYCCYYYYYYQGNGIKVHPGKGSAVLFYNLV